MRACRVVDHQAPFDHFLHDEFRPFLLDQFAGEVGSPGVTDALPMLADKGLEGPKKRIAQHDRAIQFAVWIDGEPRFAALLRVTTFGSFVRGFSPPNPKRGAGRK